MTSESRQQRRLVVLSAALVAAFLIFLALLLVPRGTGPRETVTFTTSTTVIPQSVAVTAVNESYSKHIQRIESGNVSAVVSDYSQNANATWTGKAYCLGGSYTGGVDIAAIFRSFLNKTTPGLTITNVVRTVTPQLNGTTVVVASSFDFASNKTNTIGDHIYPGVTGPISAQDLYDFSPNGSSWLISQEKWNFASLSDPVPLCGLPG